MGGATAGVAAAAAMRARRRVVSHFLSRNAVSAEHAVAFTPARRMARKFFERLQDEGVIVAARGGTYWIDVARLDAFQARHRKRVGAAMGLAAAVIGAGVAIGLLG